MKTKILIAGSILGLALSGVASAGGPVDLKPVVTSNPSQAGFVIGLQGGVAVFDNGNGPKDGFNDLANLLRPFSSKIVTESNSVPAVGRVYLGWDFNQYFGIETGLSGFSNTSDKLEATFLNGRQFNEKFTYETYAWDIFGKASLPFSPSFSAYAKLGAAYVNYKIKKETTGVLDQSRTNSAFRPAGGLGINYNFSDNFGMDLSWLCILGKSKTSYVRPMVRNLDSVIPTTNSFLLGIHYKILY